MRKHEWIRFLILGLHYLVASGLLFFGLAIGTLAYKFNPLQVAMPYFVLLLSMLVIFRIAWITRRPVTSESKGRSLWVTLPLSFGGVFTTAVFFLLLIYRRLWLG